MPEFQRVASVDEIPEGKIRKVVCEGKEVALYNAGGRIYATGNLCPHQGGPLDEGDLDGLSVICPWHGWMFNIEDGSCVMAPNIKLPVYEVDVRDGHVHIRKA
jgi:nitrite reductase (NADH) small subunit